MSASYLFFFSNETYTLLIHYTMSSSDFPPCHHAQFRCSNARCIPYNFHCDGYHDCADKSDEANCTAIACPDNKHLCPRGGASGTPKCILKSQLCDGKRDCEDGSDEETNCCEYPPGIPSLHTTYIQWKPNTIGKF